MPTHFTIQKVNSVNEWSNEYGKNYDFNLSVIDPKGGTGVIQITAKKDDRYKAGQSFWAVPTGREHRGIPKYKSAPPPDDQGSLQNAPQSSGTGPSSHFQPPRCSERAGFRLYALEGRLGPAPDGNRAVG